jgi:hypothetical protein
VDPADERENLIALADGIATVNVPGTSMATTLSGFTLPVQFDSIRALNVIADGQRGLDAVAFNSLDIGVLSAFPGADGNYWDTQILPVAKYVNPGDQSFLTRVTGVDDCLVWMLNGLVVEGYSQ